MTNMKASIYTRPPKTTLVTRRARRLSNVEDLTLPPPLAVHGATDCFVTPPVVAARMADYANLDSGFVVAEPECGTGNLIRAILDTQEAITLHANELNYDLFTSVSARFKDDDLTVTQGDFLECEGLEVDRFIMNPPYSKRQAYKHIEHARGLLAPKGLIIALVPRNFEIDGMYEIEKLPHGTFSNTAISTKIIEIGA